MLYSLVHEYRFIGFIADGGRVRRRTPAEQYLFSRQAATEGLRVVPPLSFDGKTICYPFLPHARTLDVFMRNANEKDIWQVIGQLVHDLREAHVKGRIYGDRWAGNTLVDPSFGLLHVDFDIELSGSHARELEVAQAAYHTLWSGGIRAIPPLVQALSTYRDGWFDLFRMVTYLRGFARYLNRTNVGGMEDGTELLIDTLCVQALPVKRA